jgi:hypothetical protein
MAREKRDPRRDDDPRDKRDIREGEDPRDERDEREPGDARDPIAPHVRLSIILGFFVLWLGTTGALVVYGKGIDRNSSNASHAVGLAATAQHKLRAYQVESCKREDANRVSDNRSHLDEYNFDSAITKLLRAALGRPIIKIRGINATRAHEERAEAISLLHSATASAEHLEWGHLIENCTAAVDHPEQYRFPPLVRFKTQLPPKGALELQPGE